VHRVSTLLRKRDAPLKVPRPSHDVRLPTSRRFFRHDRIFEKGQVALQPAAFRNVGWGAAAIFGTTNNPNCRFFVQQITAPEIVRRGHPARLPPMNSIGFSRAKRTNHMSQESKISSQESKISSASSDLTADLAALRDDIAKMSSALMDLVQEKAASGVLNAVDGARQTFSDKAAEAQDKVSSISADVEATIERNPLVAVLIAAFAGFVVGILSRPRK
jgi:ElaB/YqjD/DUF883 family membrane-anchored ribosome-binding protein